MKCTTLYSCPVCGRVLEADDFRYWCGNKHCFDIARQGYVNLLLANQKHSKDPGDRREMLECRRNFLDGGYYECLSEELVGLVGDYAQDWPSGEGAVLDAGCGEGYFTHYLKTGLALAGCEPCEFMGIDISKAGVALASRRDRTIRFAVASSFALPVVSDSLTCVLRMFAPGDDQEVVRCLKPGGLLVTVTPGPMHLYDLRKLIYRDPRPHEDRAGDIPGLNRLTTRSVTGCVELDHAAAVQNLLAMTPYCWTGDRKLKEQCDCLESLRTDIDFKLTVYRN